MHFEFATSSRIIFGPDTCLEVPALTASLGQRAFLVTDSLERSETLLEGLKEKGIVVEFLEVRKEPDVELVLMATRIIHESRCQVVIGFGGGSALDTGKAAGVLATNPGNPIDYLDVVGTGLVLKKNSIPYIALPTTAGTGSEVTRNAVIVVPEKRTKVSLRSPFMIPCIAVIDPKLAYSLPPSITASTGMDALTQLIEPFVCNLPTPLTDAICRDGITRTARSLQIAFENGQDAKAREDMALASLFGGMALANARLGAVHGMASPIGGVSHAPHGAICARLLPLVMELNLHALRTRQPDSSAIIRYAEIARLLTGNPHASAEDGATWVRELCQVLRISPLTEYGVKPEDYHELVAQSQKANSMKGNPIVLETEEILQLLEAAA